MNANPGHLTPALAYHRRKAARQMKCWWWTPEQIGNTEYGWLRSLDKSPRRPLERLIAAERRLA